MLLSRSLLVKEIPQNMKLGFFFFCVVLFVLRNVTIVLEQKYSSRPVCVQCFRITQTSFLGVVQGHGHYAHFTDWKLRRGAASLTRSVAELLSVNPIFKCKCWR